jgi:two-component system NarL family sensor kinase
MSTTEIFWLVIAGTTVVITLAGFLVGIVLFNQKKFIRIQQEKLDESRKLQDTLRSMPKQIVDAQEEERQRVSRDLHDGINQMLASVSYRLHTVKELFGTSDKRLAESIEGISGGIQKTMEEVKRISYNLRPKILDEFGFQPAIRNLCDDFTVRTNIQLRYELGAFPEKLLRETELGIFRIIQEALRNIEKHASATKVTLETHIENSHLIVLITDNGKGLPGWNDNQKSSTEPSRGLGMTTMKERAILIGGNINIEPNPANDRRGTSITLTVPLRS